MRTLTLSLALLVALLALPRESAAQGFRTVIVDQLNAASGPVKQSGFREEAGVFDRDVTVGMLADGTSGFLELHLREGVNYFVAAACDQDCSNLDLRLFSVESTTPVAEDNEDDDYPMLNFNAPKTGRYMLAVDMTKCEESMCYYGFKVFRK